MIQRRSPFLAAAALLVLSAFGCDHDDDKQAHPAKVADESPSEGAKPAPGAEPASLPNGLVIAYAQFEVKDGRVTAKPGPARVEMLYRKGGKWRTESFEDPSSNVFHKAMVYTPPGGKPGILTLGGTEAAVKLWHKHDGTWKADTLWKADFGGKFSRMREAEIGDVYGDGKPDIVVATHDQGVVEVLRPEDDGTFEPVQLDHQKDTFIHEIELGDLDGDGTLEVYATPSEPNKIEAGAQKGTVVRYVPAKGEGRKVVADLGDRHAKEILVDDVDGDGRDELYVAVEALTERGDNDTVEIVEPVEIRRYDADTPPEARHVIATLPDRFNRFLTAGDFDGDGKKEMVAAAFRSGVWLLRPGKDPKAAWTKKNIDADSSGFEHAAVFADLDGDGTDELYVASDEQGELRRYVWKNGKVESEVIHRQPIPGAMMTFNIMPFPEKLRE